MINHNNIAIMLSKVIDMVKQSILLERVLSVEVWLYQGYFMKILCNLKCEIQAMCIYLHIYVDTTFCLRRLRPYLPYQFNTTATGDRTTKGAKATVAMISSMLGILRFHDEVIKWKHFPRNWPFVWGIHRSPVNSPHKGQWRGALMFSLICAWINDWVNNREAGDLRRHRAHYDVIVMYGKRGLVFLTIKFIFSTRMICFYMKFCCTFALWRSHCTERVFV